MYDNILVPTDGSDTSEVAIDHAIDLALKYGATVHALYVVDVDATSYGLGTVAAATGHANEVPALQQQAG